MSFVYLSLFYQKTTLLHGILLLLSKPDAHVLMLPWIQVQL
jgi:hypothetical protein